MQRLVRRISNTNWWLRSPDEQSECRISRKFKRPSFWTGAPIVAVLDSLVRFVFVSRYLPSDGSLWNRVYRRLSWSTGYHACLTVAQMPASSCFFDDSCFASQASSSAQWRHVLSFCFITRGQHAFALRRMLICKCYVPAMAVMT